MYKRQAQNVGLCRYVATKIASKGHGINLNMGIDPRRLQFTNLDAHERYQTLIKITNALVLFPKLKIARIILVNIIKNNNGSSGLVL